MAPIPSSGIGSTPYPASSTTTVTALSSRERNLTFASEWHFKPEGVKLVKQNFEAQLRKRKIHASHRWSEVDCTFRVLCQSSDVNRVWLLFYNVIGDIIKNETGENKDDIETEAQYTWDYSEEPSMKSNLIESLETWRKENSYEETSIQEEPRQLAEPAIMAAEDHGEFFPEEIRYFKSRVSWSVNVGVDLDQVASDEDLKELEWLTGCQFVKILNEHKIYIGGHLGESCEVAAYKLENLCKYHCKKPWIDHLFYSEGEENFQVVLKPFVDIRKGYFATTLLEDLRLHAKCNYKTLGSAITVRIAPYNHSNCRYISINKLNIVPAVKPEDKDRGLPAWAEFKYSAKGEPAKHHQFLGTITQANGSVFRHDTPAPMKPLQPVNTRANKDASITRWANEVPDMTTRPFGCPMPGFGNGRADALSGCTNKNDDKPGWDTYKQFDDAPVVRIESSVRQQSHGLVANLSAMRSTMYARSTESPSSAPQSFVSQISGHNPRLRPATSRSAAPSQQPRVSMSAIFSTHPVDRRSPTQNVMAPNRLSIAPTPNPHPSAAQFESYNYNRGVHSTPTSAQMQNIDELTTAQYENPNGGSYANQTITPKQHIHPLAAAPLGALQPTTQHQVALENVRPVSVTSSLVNLVSAGNNNDNVDRFLYQQPQRSLLDDDISVVDFTYPIMEPIKWEEHATGSPSSSRPESIQPLSEVATRSFHNTMNQRASKSMPKAKQPKINPYAGRLPGPPPNPVKAPAIVDENLIDPLPEFVKELQKSFQDMMDRIRGFRGQVEVHAEFGRVLLSNIHKKHITTKGSTDTPYATEALQSVLLDAFPDGPDFTKILTTAPGEIPFLVNLTNADGQELWEKKVTEWIVKYEFCLTDRRATENPRFTIEIDAETFVTQIKKSQPLGKIFVHGPGRHWDFCIGATGSRGARGLEKEYGQLATAIDQSLHIPTNSSTPILFFELEDSMSERFQLVGVRVHHICRYKSHTAKSILNISEMHALDIQMISVPGKTLSVFKLSPGPSDRKPCEKLGKWYEVSISCDKLNDVLKQNEELELGEETRWEAKDLLDADVARSLYLPACEMLKKIDGIGQHNHNGLDIRSAMSSTVSQVSQATKEQFW